MGDYIDRVALGIGLCNRDIFGNKGYADGWNAAVKVFKEASAVDVSEVVRCKDCQNYELMKSGNYHFCNEFGGRVTEKDFCSRAQKMDGGNNNGRA